MSQKWCFCTKSKGFTLGPPYYHPCVIMAGRAILAGYHRYQVVSDGEYETWASDWSKYKEENRASLPLQSVAIVLRLNSQFIFNWWGDPWGSTYYNNLKSLWWIFNIFTCWLTCCLNKWPHFADDLFKSVELHLKASVAKWNLFRP